jgi:hypothetical protein
MSVDVTVEQPIARDRDTVARFAMDPANELAGPLLSFMVRRGIARDLRALKRALDG